MPTPCRIDTAFLLLGVLVGCTTSHLAPLPTEEGWLEANGATLYYRTFGAGEPIVVLHGGPGFDHRQFLPHIEVLASDHKVILFDQRGTGLSSGPVDSASITIENFIDDIETVRKAFGIERMNLLGHSWGGVLAMYYAIHHPDRLRSLILCSTTPSIDGFNAMRAAIARKRSPEDTRQLEQIEATEAFQHNEPDAVERFWRVYFRPYFPDPSMASRLDLTFTENTLANSSTVAHLILASVGPFDLRDSLRALRVPTLILHGDSDPLPLEYARRIQATIPGAELRVMRNAGHWIFVDATEQFRASVQMFLSGLRSPQLHSAAIRRHGQAVREVWTEAPETGRSAAHLTLLVTFFDDLGPALEEA